MPLFFVYVAHKQVSEVIDVRSRSSGVALRHVASPITFNVTFAYFLRTSYSGQNRKTTGLSNGHFFFLIRDNMGRWGVTKRCKI